MAETLGKIDASAARAAERANAGASSFESDESLSVNALLREIAPRLCEAGGVSCDLTLASDDEVVVRASRQWLPWAMRRVIENGVRFGAEGEDKRLTMKTSRLRDLVVIEITDRGKGIPEWVQKLVFKEPIPKKTGEAGGGVGLLLASTILEGMGGKIRIGETGSAGTTMVITLPAA